MYKLDVSIPVLLDRNFTYLSDHLIPAGCRVVVPFGSQNRKTVGVVIGLNQTESSPEILLKKIIEQVDQVPAYSENLMKLAYWMSQYYIYPLGEVFRSMLPASQKKRRDVRWELTQVGEAVWVDLENELQGFLRYVWKRRKSLDEKTVKKRMLEWVSTENNSMSLKKLEKGGYITRVLLTKTNTRNWEEIDKQESATKNGEPSKTLTPAQQTVVDSVSNMGLDVDSGKKKKPFLIHGITGAGKTEIYLHVIKRLLIKEPGAQVLVLVPEIALTPQMTRIFTARFPGKVSVVHSAMSSKDRWEQLALLRQKEKSILIGPRSGVFAPFFNLRLLIVDEEHDPSYKQGAGLSYNGRDVAVVRGSLEEATVILGSATPCMETYYNASNGKYHYIRLSERPFGRLLPVVELIQPKAHASYAKRLGQRSLEPQYVELPVDPGILEALDSNFKAGMQAIVIVNRRGYAYYLMSLRDKKAINCPNCSISLTVHKKSTLLRCHYCDFSQSINQVLAGADPSQYALVGYGSEQMEVFLNQALKGARIQRVDSDSTSRKDEMLSILQNFRSGEIDVLVGTQMLAKGHDFAKVALICILEVDQTLNLPDFRSGERAFQLMVQAAGRAGRDKWPGRVLIQTQRPDHPILRAGMAQNYEAFWLDQLEFRRACFYPPFSRIILFDFSSAHRDRLQDFIEQIESWIQRTLLLHQAEFASLQILGPSVPSLEVVRGRIRRTVLLMSANRRVLWSFATQLRDAFGSVPGDIAMRIDVDPQSLM